MSHIFECEQCQCADSIYSTQQTSPGYICHQCKHGEWHNEFARETYDFDRHGPALNKPDPTGASFG